MNVFLVVPMGVGEQNPVGVFLTREEAEEAAERVWTASDGYHSLLVQEREVGVVYDSFPRFDWLRGAATTAPLEGEFRPESSFKRMP